MVLKPDVAGFGHFAICPVEFVWRTVGVAPRGGPAAEIHVDNLLPVQGDADDVLHGVEDHVIPVASGIACIARGGLYIIDRAAALGGCGFTTMRIQDLDFNTGLHGVVQIGPSEEYAAVGSGRVFELERQFEIPELFVRIIQVFSAFSGAEDTALIHSPTVGIAGGCPAVEGITVE